MVESLSTEWTHDILMSNRWLLEIGLLAFMLCCKVICSGVFEVSLLKLNNNRGLTHNGHCCSGSSTSPPCVDTCKTFFSVCLNHYVQTLPSKRSCTYGSFVTQVIGENNIYSEDIDGIVIQLPIQMLWPGKFTLIAEAWHDIDGQGTIYDSSQLILQAFIVNTIQPSTTWVGDSTITPTTEMLVKYRIRCKENYYGPGCDVICRPRDDQFGHYSCAANGTKVCDPDWIGRFCDQPNCHKECLANRGVCERPYECRCRLGWQGKHCGECVPKSGCLNGRCHQPYQCICDPGWVGLICDVDSLYCTKKQPCLNAGTCVSDMGGNYTCLCSPGFGGDNCQHPLCYHSYCKNDGTCRTRHGFRECVCKDEFYGDQCEHKKIDCRKITCLNGGRCYNSKHGGKCACAEDFHGDRCGRRKNPCNNVLCENGGECRDDEEQPQGYKCLCPIGFGGPHCTVQIDPCSGITCYNGGTCLFKDGHTKPTCTCLGEFSGEFCQISSDPCSGVNCMNGGSCKASPMYNGFVCHCAVGYHGEFCESEMNPCESSPCKNGGKCKNYISSFLCICKNNHAGKYCERLKVVEELVDSTQNDDSRNEVFETDVLEVTSNKTNGSKARRFSWASIVFVFCAFQIFGTLVS